MWQNKTQKSSLPESIRALEADIQHANSLSAALPRDSGQGCFQMKVSYSPFASLLLFLIEWMDCSSLDSVPSCLGLFHILVYKVYVDDLPKISSQERRASLREFYAVIYPSLKQLGGASRELEDSCQKPQYSEILTEKGIKEEESTHQGPEREHECGICMDSGSQVVLPKCGHSMCISCYHEWLERSPSCPFCRGSLRRMSSEDLWILVGKCDVVDNITLAKQNLWQFYLYMETLPLLLMVPDNNILSFDYMV